MGPIRVMRYSAANAWVDMWVMYSPATWTFGWLSRVLMQVIFFATIGLLLDSPDAVRYLFIGNAVMVIALEVHVSVATTTWERRQGTMPLLVAAPSKLWPVFVGRSVQWLPSGLLTSSVALFGLAPLFDVSWTPARAVAAFGCLVAIGIATYFSALVLGALVLAAMNLRNVVANVATSLMMLVCGVMVPVTFWPGWVETVAQGIPLTHGLAAVRALAEAPSVGAVAGDVVVGVVSTLGVGIVWLVVAAVLLERMASAGRRAGTIEFAD
jgi:ABC-2 type transport system permease protein